MFQKVGARPIRSILTFAATICIPLSDKQPTLHTIQKVCHESFQSDITIDRTIRVGGVCCKAYCKTRPSTTDLPIGL